MASHAVTAQLVSLVRWPESENFGGPLQEVEGANIGIIGIIRMSTFCKVVLYLPQVDITKQI